MPTLRYAAAGGSLLFHDPNGARRKVRGGEVFDVDEATAATLMASDARVERFESDAVATPDEPSPTEEAESSDDATDTAPSGAVTMASMPASAKRANTRRRRRT